MSSSLGSTKLGHILEVRLLILLQDFDLLPIVVLTYLPLDLENHHLVPDSKVESHLDQSLGNLRDDSSHLVGSTSLHKKHVNVLILTFCLMISSLFLIFHRIPFP